MGVGGLESSNRLTTRASRLTLSHGCIARKPRLRFGLQSFAWQTTRHGQNDGLTYPACFWTQAIQGFRPAHLN
jgi:hypothetical protein